jgi:hypothetical protein
VIEVGDEDQQPVRGGVDVSGQRGDLILQLFQGVGIVEGIGDRGIDGGIRDRGIGGPKIGVDHRSRGGRAVGLTARITDSDPGIAERVGRPVAGITAPAPVSVSERDRLANPEEGGHLRSEANH